MKKRGSIFLWSLAFLTMILTLTAIAVNINSAYTVINRTVDIADEAARARAQAIHMQLKEVSGIVEVFHNHLNYDSNVDYYEYVDVPGHKTALLPAQYNQLFKMNQDIDYSIKTSMVQYLRTIVGNNTRSQSLLKNFSENNICFDIKPLPLTGTNNTLNFNCDVTINGETINVSIPNVPVASVEQNTKYIMYNGELQPLKVVNVVFAAVVLENRLMFQNMIFGINFDPDVVKKKVLWSVAYPQIDECYSMHCY